MARKILWTPKEVETKVLPVVVTQAVETAASTQESPRQPVSQPVVIEGGQGKYRRLKDTVKKESNKYRELEPADRDVFINWWNRNQRLVDKDDPVCQRLVDQINQNHFTTHSRPLSAAQCAGFMSHLARLARMNATLRQTRILSAQKRGSYTDYPLFSNELIRAIDENWERQRQDEGQRRRDHAALRQLRQANPRARVRAPGDVDSTVQPTVMSEIPMPPARRPQPQTRPEIDIDAILSGAFEIE